MIGTLDAQQDVPEVVTFPSRLPSDGASKLSAPCNLREGALLRAVYFDIYKTTSGYSQKYWWVAKGGNHETLCSSEMLSSK